MKRLCAAALLVVVVVATSGCTYTGATRSRSRNTPSVQSVNKCQASKTNNARASR